MSSQYYVAGPGAQWRGKVEVRDDHTWYWHNSWPERSLNPHRVDRETDLHIDEGL